MAKKPKTKSKKSPDAKKKKKSAGSNDFVRKHLFWVLCGGSLVAGLVCAILGTHALKSDYNKNLSAVNRLHQDVASVSRVNPHPTRVTNEEHQKATEEYALDVYKTWEFQYAKQKKNQLVWPPALGEDFIELVHSFPPAERIRSKSEYVIPNAMVSRYVNYIGNEIEKLPSIVGDQWVVGKSSGSRSDEKDKDRKALCFWKVDDQDRAFKRLAIRGTPSTWDVLYKQEDLWVYQALLTVISHTNTAAGATTVDDNHRAAVQSIDEMKIAKDVSSTNQSRGFKQFEGQASAPRGAASGDLGEKPFVADQGDRAGDSSRGSGKLGDEDNYLLPIDGRYVDADGRPIRGTALVSLRDDEIKRLPIYMKLEVHQDHLDRLLIECANSPLTVDVQQLSFAAPIVTTPVAEREVVAAEPDRAGEEGKDGKKMPGPQPSSVYVTVEIHGIVYIFNPPDRKKLNLPEPETKPGGKGKTPPPSVAGSGSPR
jgi:hypothetical protein